MGSAQRSVGGIGKDSMQRVTEFMEEGLHFAQGQQGGFVGSGLGEVHGDADVRATVFAVSLPLVLVFGHPCARLFRFARMEVGIEHRQVTAVLVEHLKRLYVGVIHRNLSILFERDAVKAMCQAEDTVNHLLQREVRTQHLRIEMILLLLQLLRIVTPVPRHQLHLRALQARSKLRQLLHLLAGSRRVSLQQLVQQAINMLGILRHALLQHKLSISVVTQQLRQFHTRVHNALHQLQVAVLILMRALRLVSQVKLLAQVAIAAVGEERHVAGRLQCEGPTFHTLLLRRLFRRRQRTLRHSLQHRLVRNHLQVTIRLLQMILSELHRQLAQLLAQLAVALLLRLVEVGTAAHKTVVRTLQETQLLAGAHPMFRLIHRLHAGKQRLVQRDAVGMFREHR